jgi:putative ubiquitin-RnfH superfamily antitoxin RatB of RatAB toxin-antitoxin module
MKRMRVSVAIALAEQQEVIELELPAGSRVADALRETRAFERFAGVDPAALRFGIWSRPCGPQAALRDGDRVEIYRPLQVDAKDQRRARARVKPSTRSRSGP